MNATDFTTALARLLCDPRLRSEFRSDAAAATQQLGVRPEDFAAIVAMNADELEVQARILLRKRLDIVRRIIPQTCGSLGENLWPRFEHYGLNHRLDQNQTAAEDALQFCLHLATVEPTAQSPGELNRLRFVLGKQRFALHLAKDLLFHARPRTAIQVFLRTGCERWREWAVFISWTGICNLRPARYDSITPPPRQRSSS